MFGIGIPELIIILLIGIILISPVFIVLIVLLHIKKREAKIASAYRQPPPLPQFNENDLIKTAQVLLQNRDDAGAIGALTQAIEINPESATAYYNRGVVFLKTGDRRKGINDLKSAAKMGHGKAKAYLRAKGISY